MYEAVRWGSTKKNLIFIAITSFKQTLLLFLGAAMLLFKALLILQLGILGVKSQSEIKGKQSSYFLIQFNNYRW